MYCMYSTVYVRDTCFFLSWKDFKNVQWLFMEYFGYKNFLNTLNNGYFILSILLKFLYDAKAYTVYSFAYTVHVN